MGGGANFEEEGYSVNFRPKMHENEERLVERDGAHPFPTLDHGSYLLLLS